MSKVQAKEVKRTSRHNRIRSKVAGTAARPRLAVFRSNKFIYAQLVDDEKNHTLVSSDSRKQKGALQEAAVEVGKDIAQKAKKAGIEQVVFDRGGYKYQGAVAALADAARKGGLVF